MGRYKLLGPSRSKDGRWSGLTCNITGEQRATSQWTTYLHTCTQSSATNDDMTNYHRHSNESVKDIKRQISRLEIETQETWN